ncbi:alpha amylase family protein [Dysgonomonas sp. 25]|uniref:alpha amylase family protein n=1 Tax=Dysgonomonas sp. 25 TaxID=2302933 RepID=UPI0013D08DA0|nr:alpha amylase family protein [Dysgonomonas sp. 25]NDV69701.1 S-layer protein [Dysgonomonas sp. 25]
MKKIFLLLALVPLLFASCDQKEEKTHGKEALMWFDATANFERFGNPDSIDYYLEKVHSLGFTHAVVDIRPISGEVLYDSKIVPQMLEYKGFTRDKNFDFLQHFIDKAHSLGMEVHASLNTFVAGHNYVDRGLIYDGHPEWATMVYTPEKGIVSITTQKHKYSAMVNPIDQDFQQHILSVFKEVVAKYPKLDGLILDRVRYDGIMADFSEMSKKAFEEYAGVEVKRFPEDIYEWAKGEDGKYTRKDGVHFKKWIEWRAKTIYDFMALARKEVKSVNPDISFGTYTGAWYPSYYEAGVNWASNTYDPSKDFDWATPEYKNFGYAELLDLYTTGNYYTDITIADRRANPNSVWNETDSEAQSGDWYCVEGSCEKIRGILGNKTFSGGILVDQFYNKPEDLTRSIEMDLAKSDGVMVFDIVHIIEKNLWKEVETGMRNGGMIE